MAVDFGLQWFRNYCVGAKNISVVTDHKPLKAIFENKRLGSIRIDRTNLRHQDIDYKIVWRPGKLNPSNYLSRNSKISNEYIEEANEDTKLLYYLDNDQYVMNNVTSKHIIDETKRDVKNIYNELTVSAKGLLLQGEHIILPRSLHEIAVKKAHSMGHIGCSGLKRQIRSHFAFQKLDEYVESEIRNCKDCQMFTEKGNKALFSPVYVPQQAWDYVLIFLDPCQMVNMGLLYKTYAPNTELLY